MSKKNAFNELLDTAMATHSGLSEMVEAVSKPVTEPTLPSSIRAKHEVTVDERRALDERRNAQRGRGRSKGTRKMIAFQVPDEKVQRIEDLCYALGKTKNELYNEALDSLISKYKNI